MTHCAKTVGIVLGDLEDVRVARDVKAAGIALVEPIGVAA